MKFYKKWKTEAGKSISLIPEDVEFTGNYTGRFLQNGVYYIGMEYQHKTSKVKYIKKALYEDEREKINNDSIYDIKPNILMDSYDVVLRGVSYNEDRHIKDFKLASRDEKDRIRIRVLQVLYNTYKNNKKLQEGIYLWLKYEKSFYMDLSNKSPSSYPKNANAKLLAWREKNPTLHEYILNDYERERKLRESGSDSSSGNE